MQPYERNPIWVDWPAKDTPIFAVNLNKYEDAHEAAVAAITAVEEEIGTLASPDERTASAINTQDSASEAAVDGRVTFGAPGASAIAIATDGSVIRAEVDARANAAVAEIAPTGGVRAVGKGELFVDVRSYGAAGDGVTDDTEAIKAAVTDGVAKGNRTVLFPESTSGYLTTDTITFPANSNVAMRGQILYGGPRNRTAIVYGEAGVITLFAVVELKVKASGTPSVADWSNMNYRGIDVINVQRSRVTIHKVWSFAVGVRLASTGAGNAYNIYELNTLYNCRYGLELYSDAGGWVNENLFLGGGFSNQSGLNAALDRACVRVLAGGDGYTQNANVFVKPSFEIGNGITDKTLCVPVVITGGSLNVFEHCRAEGVGPVVIKTSGKSQNNYIGTTFTDTDGGSAVDIGENPSTITRPAQSITQWSANRLVFAATDLPGRAVAYTPSSSIYTLYGTTIVSTGGVFGSLGAAAVTGSYIETLSGRGIGITLDVSKVKRFVIGGVREVGFGGRAFVKCYDSTGAEVTYDPANPHVRGVSNRGFSYSSAYGGCYRTGSDTDESVYVAVVNPSVSTVVMGFAHGGSALRIRSLTIHTPDTGGVAAWADQLPFPAAAAAPDRGTFVRGARVYHVNPSSGQPQGWVCTAAGTPGTWVAMPNL